MQHLNTTTCKCGYVFIPQDIKPPLNRVPNTNFYGGRVTRFSNTECRSCGLGYALWLQPTGQTWRVVTIAPRGWSEDEKTDGDEFGVMEKPELKAWLDARAIEYTPQWGDKRLRELCRLNIDAEVVTND